MVRKDILFVIFSACVAANVLLGVQVEFPIRPECSLINNRLNIFTAEGCNKYVPVTLILGVVSYFGILYKNEIKQSGKLLGALLIALFVLNFLVISPMRELVDNHSYVFNMTKDYVANITN